MRKFVSFNRRSKSLAKPLFFLLLQIVIILEIFSLFNANFNIFTWGAVELIIALSLIIYFITHTYKIIHRETQKTTSDWQDKADMEKFLTKN